MSNTLIDQVRDKYAAVANSPLTNHHDGVRAAAQRDGYTHVEFRLGEIDALPIPDASVDVVISNCVINLAPNKNKVFREIARVLKPGGRVAISDILLKQPLPPELAQSLAAYVGCIAGALPVDHYIQGLLAAGLRHIQILDSNADLNAYGKLENQSACCSPTMTADPDPAPAQPDSACCTPTPVGLTVSGSKPADLHTDLKSLLARFNINDFAASMKIYALK